MHISEGVLSIPVLAGGWVLAGAGTAIGLRKMDYDRIMSVAMLSAAFFVASLIHVPIGPSSAHLILNGLLGIVLGWACFPAILVALFLQAVLFQFGGLAVLGVNTCDMAIPALLAGIICRPLLQRGAFAGTAAAFGAGFFSVLASALLMATALTLTSSGFVDTAKLVILGNSPIMLIEGFITLFAVKFVRKVQPELLGMPVAPSLA